MPHPAGCRCEACWRPSWLVLAGAVVLATVAACATPATVPATVNLVACVYERADHDAHVQPPMTDLAITADVAAYCATDAGTVIATLAARKAERERQAK
jgi:hypothetical protein